MCIRGYVCVSPWFGHRVSPRYQIRVIGLAASAFSLWAILLTLYEILMLSLVLKSWLLISRKQHRFQGKLLSFQRPLLPPIFLSCLRSKQYNKDLFANSWLSVWLCHIYLLVSVDGNSLGSSPCIETEDIGSAIGICIPVSQSGCPLGAPPGSGNW